MNRHLRDAGRTIIPAHDDPHGPLPGLLVLLTVVTGLVDAFSYLRLGRVFVANMTGNVVFLSFDLGGASGFVWWASLLAVVAFLLGAFGGGDIARRYGAHRGRHLRNAAGLQAVLVAAAVVIGFAVHQPYRSGNLAVLVILLGLAMGLQNATARALAVPDLTTTVLTLTLTGITSDGAAQGGGSSKLGRRSVSVASMFVGGLVGAALIENGASSWSLFIAVVLLAAVVAGTSRTLPSTTAWTAQR